MHTYKSLSDAVGKAGSCSQNIGSACKNGHRCVGFQWRYIEGELKKNIAKFVPLKRSKQLKAIIGDITIIYDSTEEAVQFHGHHRTNISKFISGKRKDPNGFRWNRC